MKTFTPLSQQFYDLYYLLERQAQRIKEETQGTATINTYKLGGGIFQTITNTKTQAKEKIILL